MRHVASALLLVALAMGGGTACQATADPPGGGRGGDDEKGRRAAPAWVGDTVDLRGRAFGERLRVSVGGWVDPAVSTRAAYQPDTGNRWLGVQLSLVNLGGRAFDASRATAWAVDGGGKRYPVVRTGAITTGFPLKWNTIASGEQLDGWLVFEVPEATRIVRLHATVGKKALTWQLQHPPSR
ncbi:DUF4352 domain-containing protein [Streptomyces sp. NPDC020965]|uniref:DUF4352 domain-containing protein n=1 Tax=Streptomyces sp. NPDC020965 TaxID=3365105 RepID=UPI0037977ECD